MASACDCNTATIPYSNKNTFVSALVTWKSKHNNFYCSSGSREEQSPFPGRGDTEVSRSLLRGTISLPCPPPWITILEEGFVVGAREAGSSLTLMSLTKTKIYVQQPYLKQEYQGTTWGNRWQSPRQLSPNKKLGSTHHRSGPIPTAEAGLRYRDHKIMFACFVGKRWLWLRQAFGIQEK